MVFYLSSLFIVLIDAAGHIGEDKGTQCQCVICVFSLKGTY